MSQQKFSLGEPEFFSTSQLRTYCMNGRNLLRPLHNELAISAEELQAVLSQFRGSPYALGVDSRVRAKLVSAHLRHAADAVAVASGSLIKTFQSFTKNYEAELHPERHRQRPVFRFDQ